MVKKDYDLDWDDYYDHDTLNQVTDYDLDWDDYYDHDTLNQVTDYNLDWDDYYNHDTLNQVTDYVFDRDDYYGIAPKLGLFYTLLPPPLNSLYTCYISLESYSLLSI